jgi:hypothetical protein
VVHLLLLDLFLEEGLVLEHRLCTPPTQGLVPY